MQTQPNTKQLSGPEKLAGLSSHTPRLLSARFARQFFCPFSPNAEPGPRLLSLSLINIRVSLDIMVGNLGVIGPHEQKS